MEKFVSFYEKTLNGYIYYIDGIKGSDNTAFFALVGAFSGGMADAYSYVRNGIPGALKVLSCNPNSSESFYNLSSRLGIYYNFTGEPYRFSTGVIRPIQCDDPYIK